MPNQPRADNPVRCIRIEDALWQRAQARADRESVETGTRVTTSVVVRDALEAYVKEEKE
jgi:hypothetical protein